ncbi:MAG TPA: L-rhamnose isomerase [Prolixibacteraceae bacterium]|nr:L-rhamnose isomerase [Prolixibacteraceae bacterium]
MDGRKDASVNDAYKYSKEMYGKLGIDIDEVLRKLNHFAICMNCWPGDSFDNFVNPDAGLWDDIHATGNYPGRARTTQELRHDLNKAISLIPGKHKLNVHAMYAETDNGKVDRNELKPEHFKSWVDWAKGKKMGLDFNTTCFSHKMSTDGYTLNHPDRDVRNFWIDHCKASRKIGEYFGGELNKPSITSIWMPDGFKNIPQDQLASRQILKESLDEIFKEKIPVELNQDSIGSKLFSTDPENYVVGSLEFYIGYAVKNNKLVCLDTGNFNSTGATADKISSLLLFCNEIVLNIRKQTAYKHINSATRPSYCNEFLMNVNRPVRCDSGYAVLLNDDLEGIARDIAGGGFLEKVHIGLDFFDVSINRITAWVTGMRNMMKALLSAMLEPCRLDCSMTVSRHRFDFDGDFALRLAYVDELKSKTLRSIWDYYCIMNEVPVGEAWIDEIKAYQKDVLSKR